MKKTFTVLLLAALLAFGLCAAARADFYARVYNTESLNIRSGPGTEYAWLGSVAKDGQVRVVGESGNWYQVVTMDGAIRGYMSKNFLIADTAPTWANQGGTHGVVVNTNSLNVRSGPGTEYNWLGSVAKGNWVQITGESGNWYSVVVVDTGLAGYMSKNFINVWYAQSPASNVAVVQNPAGTRFLNLRETPSYTAKVLDIFYNGETCTVLNRQADGWVYVSAVKDGQTLYGYFRGEYLSASGGGTSARVNTSRNGGNGGSLNLRSAPMITAGVARTIPNGAIVTVLLQGVKWWQVMYDGTVGFADSAFLGGSGGSAQPVTGTVVRTGNGGKLNLREQANANARVLGQYANGTPVTVVQSGSAWSLVKIGGQQGYVMSKFLSTGSGTATKTVRNTNGGSYVNLRTAPEKTSGNINVRVPDGSQVSLLAWGQEWSQVSYNGVTGYMMSWFLK